MADDIKVNLKVVADPQGAAEAGKADAAAYSDSFKKLRSKEDVRAEQEANRQLLQSLSAKGKAVSKIADDAQRYADWLKKAANENEKLAKSMTSGKWSISKLPIAKPIEAVSGQFLNAHVLAFEKHKEKLAETAKQMEGRFEAMDLLAKQNFSSSDIDKAAEMAMQDVKYYEELEKKKEKDAKKNEAERIKSEKNIALEQEKADKAKERRNTRYMKATESLIKNAMFLSAPFVGFGRSFVARQTFDATRTERGKSIQSGLGLGTSIGGSLGLTAIAMALITAAELAQKGLQMLAQKAVESVRFSQANFAKAAISGFGMKGQTYRSIVSNILGVDEREIMRFGSALAYINPKIKTATETLQMNALPLAKLGIDLKILETKFLALGSTLATSLMPIIEKIINFASESADEMSQKADKWGDAAKMAFKAMGNMLSGMSPEDAATKAKLDVLSSKTEKGKYGLAAPVPFMKQMPASAWEKMGLVIGGGVGTNYGKQTADNTKKSAKHLEQIAAKIGVGDRSQAAIYSLP